MQHRTANRRCIEAGPVGAIAIAESQRRPHGPVAFRAQRVQSAFMFRDDAQLAHMIDGPIGDETAQEAVRIIRPRDLIGLCGMNAGTRNVLNSKKPNPGVSAPTSRGSRYPDGWGTSRSCRHHERAGRQASPWASSDVNRCRPACVVGREQFYRPTRQEQRFTLRQIYFASPPTSDSDPRNILAVLQEANGTRSRATIRRMTRQVCQSEAQQEERKNIGKQRQETVESECRQAGRRRSSNIDDKNIPGRGFSTVWEKIRKQAAELIREHIKT